MAGETATARTPVTAIELDVSYAPLPGIRFGALRSPVRTAGQAARLARAKELAKQTRTAKGTLLDDPLFAAEMAGVEIELMAMSTTNLRMLSAAGVGRGIADRFLEARRRGWQDRDDEGRLLRRTTGVASLGGATLDNEENYLIKKLFTAAGAIQIENQARI